MNSTIKPVLSLAGEVIPQLDHEDVGPLMLGTSLKESLLCRQYQMGNGPARSLFQIEVNTHSWLLDSVISKNPSLMKIANWFLMPGMTPIEQLAGNSLYACFICRIRYYVVKEALPSRHDIEGMAQYWGKYYQTKSIPSEMFEWESRYRKYGNVTW